MFRLSKTPAARNNRKIAITKKGIDFCRVHILPVVGALEAAYIRLSDEGRKIYLTSGIRGHSILHKEIQSIMSTRERREPDEEIAFLFERLLQNRDQASGNHRGQRPAEDGPNTKRRALLRGRMQGSPQRFIAIYLCFF